LKDESKEESRPTTSGDQVEEDKEADVAAKDDGEKQDEEGRAGETENGVIEQIGEANKPEVGKRTLRIIFKGNRPIKYAFFDL
jgi:hypothetical protein